MIQCFIFFKHDTKLKVRVSRCIQNSFLLLKPCKCGFQAKNAHNFALIKDKNRQELGHAYWYNNDFWWNTRGCLAY